MEQKLDMEHRLTEVESSSKQAHKRLDEFHGELLNLQELVKSVSALATNQGHMKEQLDKVSENVESIMLQPVKRWDAVVTAIIGAVVGILVGMMFSGM